MTDDPMSSTISIRGARQHNLKNFDLEIPRRALVVITGPSGSGKSSLAFDTIYAEGQRRYVESLSTYAKQFLERMEKPDVDRVDGISPAVAIEQRNPTKTSRSTVGTATEVYDYLRLLWARVGRTICPGSPEHPCGREVKPDTVQSATDAILSLPAGSRAMICFPLPLSARVTHDLVVENLRAMGFLRLLADGRELHLDELPEDLDLTEAGELLVVVDRLRVNPEDIGRLTDSLQTAFVEGDGEVRVPVEGGRVLQFTERFRCPDHPEIAFAVPSPQLFSFNNPYGSCPECTGFGAVLEYDESLIVPNPSRSIAEGAVDPWSKPRYDLRRRKLDELARIEGVSTDVPWSDLPEEFRGIVLEGRKGFQGVFSFLRDLERKRYKQYIRVFLRQYQSAQTCPTCQGAKLRPAAAWVKVAGRRMDEVVTMPLGELRAWVEGLGSSGIGDALSVMETEIADTILQELRARLEFLDDVGLGYLTLDRQTRSLSGGEAQRITLANALGSKLMDTLYVLDEPTIGLHPADNDRLLKLLLRLRDAGNTVLVVEHDPDAMRIADHLVELGPGSGERGGEVVFQGTPDELLTADTLTGRYLSGREAIPTPRGHAVDGPALSLTGAREHNLKRIDISIPLRALTVVTGISGSGKSTLVHDVLYRALERELSGGETTAKRHLGESVGSYDELTGAGRIEQVVLIDQSPIGRTSRSNPVTYIKAYDEVRRLFASLSESKKRGYSAGHFSFNVDGGRCEACKGEGQVQVEMVFMADIYVPCEICGGSRFKAEVLEVTYAGKNIRDVLDLTVDEAIRFFLHEDRLGQALWQLQQVGLGYLRLGQPAPTLSGGEAQRIKIARELAMGARRRGSKLYILDEPTTGLHLDDIRKLLQVLGDLVDAGHTVVLIEHNLDVIRTADWIIDLGPGAGPGGGEVVAMGTPDQVADSPRSVTGRYLLRERAPVP
ncbi:MAG TPA: excinuclease ABC subunit UvrA [Longimicrobiaceae bacterium]|nr:excinuclease ABC subunit UvrA [Longimicrobiaceae bacterium]